MGNVDTQFVLSPLERMLREQRERLYASIDLRSVRFDGRQLRRARENAQLQAADMTRVFGIKTGSYQKYEVSPTRRARYPLADRLLQLCHLLRIYDVLDLAEDAARVKAAFEQIYPDRAAPAVLIPAWVRLNTIHLDHAALKAARLRSVVMGMDEVARILGKSPQAICSYEVGTRHPPADILLRLCFLYGIRNLLLLATWPGTEKAV